jgi:hypothetical protein
MISEKEFDKEAAMLAAMTGGHLNSVDKMMVERAGNQSANRIDIQSFIGTYKHGDQPRVNRYDPANQGYVAEEIIQQLVPDTAIFSKPDNISIEVTPAIHRNSSPQPPPVVANEEFSKVAEDIASIKSLMERINGNLTKISGMMGKVFCNLNEKGSLNK